ncbi:hypothetical protein GQ44DRAFT_670085 [Phaeosphaeriaceae sp. PMI808]|nr:hypothetical protein GQ44DRAFT_670085 [Phaeosphaeriaceae sp. PMI808]
MLIHPDRKRFEQVRAHWEAVELRNEESVNMGGRKLHQQPTKRKPTNNPVLAVAAPSTNSFALQYGMPHQSTRPSTSLEQFNDSSRKAKDPANDKNSRESQGPGAILKALPRSHTTSFLPRPVNSEASASTIGSENKMKYQLPVVVASPQLYAVPSKIPTPSPPLSERRGPSPRQHLHRYTSPVSNSTTIHQSIAVDATGSPTRAAMRSRTTPNLAVVANSQPASCMVPKTSTNKRVTTAPTIQRRTLQENIPIKQRVNERRPQPCEKVLERKSLAVPKSVLNRRSFGAGVPLTPIKQLNRGTPPVTKPRLSSNAAQLTPRQTPLTTRRAQPNKQVVQAGGFANITHGTSIEQSRLLGPRNPPTPTPPQVDIGESTSLPPTANKDMRRKIMGTPNGLGGVWRSSRALATANHEVRRVPRSSTFHNFGSGASYKTAPPVPPIPEKYRTSSVPNILQASRMTREACHKPRHHRIVSISSIPEGREEDFHFNDATLTSELNHSRSDSLELSDSSSDFGLISRLQQQLSQSPDRSLTSSPKKLACSSNEQLLSTSGRQYESNADNETQLQVRDYMPLLYWAGRFQTRFDIWQHEVTMAEFDSTHQREGQLGQYSWDQESIAKCCIIAEMRNLCITKEAADSLLEFECRYRKVHKLPNDFANTALTIDTSRKHDEQDIHKGAFGRAVRKLTPRKSSFVNLLKGKGRV